MGGDDVGDVRHVAGELQVEVDLEDGHEEDGDGEGPFPPAVEPDEGEDAAGALAGLDLHLPLLPHKRSPVIGCYCPR